MTSFTDTANVQESIANVYMINICILNNFFKKIFWFLLVEIEMKYLQNWYMYISTNLTKGFPHNGYNKFVLPFILYLIEICLMS